ncbi:hypothetical protein SHIRM173S_04892 [Streptomyces hirsutus]
MLPANWPGPAWRAPKGPPGRRSHGRGRQGGRPARRGRRGAYLIAADLAGADLRGADLIGADLRDTDVTDADLTGAFFLTQPQLNATRGSAGTTLPGTLTRPAHWTAGA